MLVPESGAASSTVTILPQVAAAGWRFSVPPNVQTGILGGPHSMGAGAAQQLEQVHSEVRALASGQAGNKR